MINAQKAYEMVEANVKKKEEEQQAKIVRFINERCEPVILSAVEDCKFEAFVIVPEAMECHIHAISTMIQIDGYKTQIRHGSEAGILIRWGKNA